VNYHFNLYQKLFNQRSKAPAGMVFLRAITFFIIAICATGVFGGEEMRLTITDGMTTNFMIQPDGKAVIAVENRLAEPYLWIMGCGTESRNGEFGWCWSLKIEANGRPLTPDMLFSNQPTYQMPWNVRNAGKNLDKYEKDQGWKFKFDNNFIMNDGTSDAYKTDGLTHWYAFSLKGIMTTGKNELVLTDAWQNDGGDRGYKKNYKAVFKIGEIGIVTRDDVEKRILDYERQQIKIDFSVLPKAEEIPAGSAPVIEVRDGCLVKNGRPYYQLHIQGLTSSSESYRNLLYFNWGNSLEIGATDVMRMTKLLTSDWKEEEFIPRDALKLFADFYRNDILGDLSFIPYNVSSRFVLRDETMGRIPDIKAIDSRGQIAESPEYGGLYPNLGSAGYQQCIREAMWKFGQAMNRHPALGAIAAHEELAWRCNGAYLPPQDDGSRQRYRDMLRSKYGEISRLNEEWGSQYKDFGEIQPPKTREATASFINFQEFRASLVNSYAKNLYQALKEAFPGKPVAAEASGGEYYHGGWGSGASRWLDTKWCDIRTGGSGNSLALLRAEVRWAGADRIVPQSAAWVFCQYRDKVIRSVATRPFWQVTNTVRDVHGNEMAPATFFTRHLKYPFEGLKCNFTYAYDSFDWHLVHRDFSQFETYSATNLPKAFIEPYAYDVGRAQGVIYKLAPLLLPARLPLGKVAMLYMRKSNLIGWTLDESLKGVTGAYIPLEERDSIEAMMQHMHVPFEVTSDELMNEWGEFKAILVGYWATLGSAEAAGKLKEYVKRKGHLIMMPEAFRYNEKNLKEEAAIPGFGLDEITRCRVVRKISGDKPVEVEILEDMGEGAKKGTILTVMGLVTPVNVMEGGRVVGRIKGTGEPVIVASHDDRVWYVGFTIGRSYGKSADEGEALRGMMEKMVDGAAARPIKVEGNRNHRVYTRHLEGKGYWLVGCLNEDKEQREVRLYPDFLPPGEWRVVELSREGKPDLVAEEIKTQKLKEAGISVRMESDDGKVFLIRASAEEVNVDCPEYEIKAIVRVPEIGLIVGEGLSERIVKATEQLVKKLEADGVRVKRVTPAIQQEEYVARCGSVELAKLTNAVIQTDCNLIMVGNMENNKWINHLAGKHYTYDKLMEDVDGSYPGKGRGVIQVSESVNKAYYCPTDKSREALIISGSDEDGLVRALERCRDIMIK